jgi:predicted GNAT family acetyltransferase
MDTAALAVRDNAVEHRYELVRDGEVLGFVTYRPRGEALVLEHTEVDPARRERGLGTRLVQGALDDLRARGIRVVPLCPFVRAYLDRHTEAT